MNQQTIALVAFLILSIACVTIFFFASRKIFTEQPDALRTSLSEQLPPADVNYLLSTDSVDTNNIDSLIYLAQRIRKIRSPIVKAKNARNLELWIAINLVIAEHRTFQIKAKSIFRWILFLWLVLAVINFWIVGTSISRL
jgi:hypothetical protein